MLVGIDQHWVLLKSHLILVEPIQLYNQLQYLGHLVRFDQLGDQLQPLDFLVFPYQLDNQFQPLDYLDLDYRHHYPLQPPVVPDFYCLNQNQLQQHNLFD